jgi:hypothetical protein
MNAARLSGLDVRPACVVDHHLIHSAHWIRRYTLERIYKHHETNTVLVNLRNWHCGPTTVPDDAATTTMPGGHTHVLFEQDDMPEHCVL